MLEALMCSELSERQFKVTLAIIRQTLGYQRDSAALSLLDISKLTGIAKPHISPILKQLEALHIVTITAATGRTPQVVAMEQDVSKWLTGSATVPESGTVTKSVTVTDSVTVTKSVTKGYQIGNGKGYQIGNGYLIKENIKENSKEREGGTVTKSVTVPKSGTVDNTPTPTRSPYGYYKNVFLSAEELDYLNQHFGEWNAKRYIDKLDSYLKEHPEKQYKDHAATLRKWLNEDYITKDVGKPTPEALKPQIDISKYEEAAKLGGIW